MPLPSDSEKMSDQDLAAALQAMEKKYAELEKKHAELLEQEKKTQAAKAKLLQDNADLKAKLAAALEQNQVVCELLPSFKDTVTSVLKETKKLFEIDMADPAQVAESIEKLFEHFLDAARKSKSLRNGYKKKGSEKLTAKAERKQANKANKDVKEAVEASLDAMKAQVKEAAGQLNIFTIASKAAASLTPEEDETRGQKAVREALSEGPVAQEYLKTEAKRSGKQALRPLEEPKKVSARPASKTKCPECHKELQVWGRILKKIRTLETRVNQLGTRCEAVMETKTCACGHVEVELAPDSPVPLFPQSSMSINLLLEVANLHVASGIPINRIKDLLLPFMQFGGETLYKAEKELVNFYLKPLVKAILEKAKKAEVVLCDETHYRCLQKNGEGVCEKPEDPTSSESLILSVCAGPAEAYPFAVYKPLRTRSADSLEEALEGWTPTVLVTDAYPGYDSLLKRAPFKNRTKHQVCLFHFRRAVLESLSLKEWKKDLKEKDGELKVLKKMRELLLSDSPHAKILAVLKEVSRIAVLERGTRLRPEESLEECKKRILAIRAQEREIMARIDLIIEELAQTQAKYENSRWVAQTGACYGTPVVYFLNHREEMKTFLGDWRIPCHTNTVERAIRSATILRKNSNFFQSSENMDAACDLYTLFETASLYGIADPVEWLLDYCRAVFEHVYSAALTLEMKTALKEKRDLKDPNTGLRLDWKKEWKKLSEGFDATPWHPWNFSKLLKS